MGKHKTKNDEHTVDNHITAPDGGWGWVVVLGAFLMNFMIWGDVHSFGVLYVALLELFQQSSGTTAWVGSIANSVGLLLAPVSSALSNRFSCRTMVVVGGLIVSSGWVASSFVSKLEYLFLTNGLIAGIGKSLAYTPSIIMVGQWFDKRRSLANGITAAGAALGTFAFAPLLTTLLHEFEFSGTMRIMGGGMLLVCVCGALLRPVPRTHEQKQNKPELKGESNKTDIVANYISDCNGNSFDQTSFDSGINIIDNSLTTSSEQRSGNERNEVYVSRTSKTINIENTINKADQYREGNDHLNNDIETKSNECEREKIANDDIVITCLNVEIKCLSDKDKSQINMDQNLESKKRRTITDLIDYTLLKNPIFICFGVSAMLVTLGHSPSAVMLPPMAKQYHVTSDDIAYLISMMGITDLIGRLLFCVMCDITFLKQKRKYLYVASVLISGVLNITCGFANKYWHFATYSVIFGLFSGAYNALTPIILVDLLGIKRLSSSFGLALLFHGFGFLLGPPIAGWLRDLSGNYQLSFYFAGSSMVLSSLVINIPDIWESLTRKGQRHEQNWIPTFQENIGFEEKDDTACKLKSISVISEADMCRTVQCHCDDTIAYAK